MSLSERFWKWETELRYVRFPALLKEPVIRRGGLAHAARRHGLTMGTVFSFADLSNPRFRRFVARNFDCITVENEMKPSFIFNHWGTAHSKDGMPVMGFRTADRIVSWARANGLKVRGHALAYHLGLPEWFFHEGYDETLPPVSREVARERVACMIKRTIVHFETKFPGTVFCWDVVNEAIGEKPGEYDPCDPRRIRTSREGVQNVFAKYLGNDYPEWCFLAAREAVDELGANIGLFLNDFNTTGAKKPYLIALADDINHHSTDAEGRPRRLVDGIGMQGYLGSPAYRERCLDEGMIGQMRQAILDYAAAGFEVQVTELTVRSFEKGAASDHAAYCARLVSMLSELAEDPAVPFSCVSIWGVADRPNPTDDEDCRWNPYGGLLDSSLRPKEAWGSVLRALR